MEPPVHNEAQALKRSNINEGIKHDWRKAAEENIVCSQWAVCGLTQSY